jgi:hypothetical protein
MAERKKMNGWRLVHRSRTEPPQFLVYRVEKKA